MTPEQFCYWLQGRAELMPETPPSADEWKMIGEHLKTVFVKVTPQQPQQPAYAGLNPLAQFQKAAQCSPSFGVGPPLQC